jgi:hypothetical protein
MVYLHKLSQDAQKVVLALALLAASEAASGCNSQAAPAADAAPEPPAWTPAPTPTVKVWPTVTPALTPTITPTLTIPAATPVAETTPPSAAPAMPHAGARLPLAEIRWVRILWPASGARHLVFGIESPWPDAAYHWSASGGRIIFTDAGVLWAPPAGPGRYVLQVIADWGADGLAMDAALLVVDQQGGVTPA